MKSAKEVIQVQRKNITERVSSIVKHSQKYAVLDFPNHPNVGDSAIWLGEMMMLQKIMGRQPAYVCDFASLDRELCQKAIGDGPIFLHGGGNFGNIYAHHHDFRLKVFSDFPQNQIILMPQSVAFMNNGATDETARTINAHKNHVLLARDQVSLEFFASHFDCESYLTPDAALCLGPLARPCAASVNFALLLRTDGERVSFASEPFDLLDGAVTMDWLEEAADTGAKCYRQAMVRSLMTCASSPNKRRLIRYNRLAETRVQRGLNILSQGRVVVTDRLHAHILSLLLDIPNVLLDNYYGKIGRYVDAWTNDYAHMRRATTAEAAIALARPLLN